MEYKVTRIEPVREVRNDMVGILWYYLVYCRVYTDSTHERFWRRRFVMHFSADDVADYFCDDSGKYPKVTQKRKNFYKSEMAWHWAEMYIGYNNTIEAVTKDCDDTIQAYNEMYAPPKTFYR